MASRPRPIAFADYSAVFGLVILSVLTFWRVCGFWFTDVDALSLIASGRFSSGQDVLHILRSELMLGRMPNAVYYRPLLSLAYGVLWHFFGFQPFGYHLMDVILHGANAGWVYLLCRALFPELKRLWAFVAAVFFLWHPLQVENVAAIARLGDLLATFCISGALYFYLRGAQGYAKSGRLSGIALATVAMGVKEPAILVVPLLSFVEWRLNSTKALVRTLPLWLAAAGFLILRHNALGGLGGYAPIVERSAAAEFFFRLQFNVMGHLVALPLAELSSEHLQRVVGFFKSSSLRWGGLWLGLMSSTAVYLWNRRREARVMILVCFVFLQFIMIHLSFFMFRYLYLSLVPVALLAVFEFSKVFDKEKRAGISAVAAGVFLAASVLGAPFLHWNLYERWRESAEIARQFTRGLEQQVQNHPQIENVFCLSVPYKRLYRPQTYFFWDMPQTQILLEHAVQDFLTLRFPEHPPRFIGLSYLYLNDDLLHYRAQAYFGADSHDILQLEPQGAEVIDYPWVKLPGRVSDADLFSYVDVPTSKLKQLRLTDKAQALPRSLFLLFGDRGEMFEVKSAFNRSVD